MFGQTLAYSVTVTRVASAPSSIVAAASRDAAALGQYMARKTARIAAASKGFRRMNVWKRGCDQKRRCKTNDCSWIMNVVAW